MQDREFAPAASGNPHVKTRTLADLDEADREERDERQEIRDEPRSGQQKKADPGAASNSEWRRRGACIPRADHGVLPVGHPGALSTAIRASDRMQRWRGYEELWRNPAGAVPLIIALQLPCAAQAPGSIHGRRYRLAPGESPRGRWVAEP